MLHRALKRLLALLRFGRRPPGAGRDHKRDLAILAGLATNSGRSRVRGSSTPSTRRARRGAVV